MAEARRLYAPLPGSLLRCPPGLSPLPGRPSDWVARRVEALLLQQHGRLQRRRCGDSGGSGAQPGADAVASARATYDAKLRHRFMLLDDVVAAPGGGGAAKRALATAAAAARAAFAPDPPARRPRPAGAAAPLSARGARRAARAAWLPSPPPAAVVRTLHARWLAYAASALRLAPPAVAVGSLELVGAAIRVSACGAGGPPGLVGAEGVVLSVGPTALRLLTPLHADGGDDGGDGGNGAGGAGAQATQQADQQWPPGGGDGGAATQPRHEQQRLEREREPRRGPRVVVVPLTGSRFAFAAGGWEAEVGGDALRADEARRRAAAAAGGAGGEAAGRRGGGGARAAAAATPARARGRRGGVRAA